MYLKSIVKTSDFIKLTFFIDNDNDNCSSNSKKKYQYEIMDIKYTLIINMHSPDLSW